MQAAQCNYMYVYTPCIRKLKSCSQAAFPLKEQKGEKDAWLSAHASIVRRILTKVYFRYFCDIYIRLLTVH